MSQQITKNLAENNLLVTITVKQLRDLVREELQAAMGQRMTTNTTNPEKAYLNVESAAALSDLGKSTIRLYIRQGKIPAHHVGRRILIERADLVKFLNSNRSEILN
jgi:excisionase family DNA binding protein